MYFYILYDVISSIYYYAKALFDYIFIYIAQRWAVRNMYIIDMIIASNDRVLFLI